MILPYRIMFFPDFLEWNSFSFGLDFESNTILMICLFPTGYAVFITYSLSFMFYFPSFYSAYFGFFWGRK